MPNSTSQTGWRKMNASLERKKVAGVWAGNINCWYRISTTPWKILVEDPFLKPELPIGYNKSVCILQGSILRPTDNWSSILPLRCWCLVFSVWNTVCIVLRYTVYVLMCAYRFVVKNWPEISCPKLTWLYNYNCMRSDNANKGLIVIRNFYSTKHSFLKQLVQFNWSLVFKCQWDLHFFLENQRFKNKMIEFAHHCFKSRKYYLYEKNGRRFLPVPWMDISINFTLNAGG